MADQLDPRAVAIVGLACRFPDADDPATFWDNLRTGRISFREIPADRWDHRLFFSDVTRELDRTYVTRGAFLDRVGDFAALHFGIAPRRVVAMDPQHRLILATVREALQDAGWEQSGFDRSRMGTFLGVSSSEYRTLLATRPVALQLAGGMFGPTSTAAAQAIAAAASQAEPISAFSIPGTLLNMTAANVAHLWNLGGPAYSIDAACASALVAVHDAVVHLRAGLCDTALAGGVYLNLTPENLIGFSRAGAVSRLGACRPFDAESDGFLQGEGAAVLVLERLADALRQGDRIYAVIRGTGINNDGNTSDGPMAPSQSGQADCLRRAYRDAGLAPTSVELLECHGTATKVGDPVEVAALQDVCREHPAPDHPIWLSSVKGNIGHTMSAAGVAGLLRAVLALQHETIPPQAGFRSPNPLLRLDGGPFRIPQEPIPWPRRDGAPRRAGVSSFGFGGTNCHVVLEEPPPLPPGLSDSAGGVRQPTEEYLTHLFLDAAPQPELFLIAAENRLLLARHARELAATLERKPTLPLAQVAHTLTATRSLGPHRLALVTGERDALVRGWRDAADRLETGEALPPELAPGIYVTPTGLEEGAEPPRVAFLFPGQGAQRVGLLRWLFDHAAGFRTRLTELADTLADEPGPPLLDLLYPPAGTAPEEAEARLQATQHCQPVMAALGLALAGYLADLGLQPAMTLGHSLGEFVAAAVGGILSPPAALRFVAERGQRIAGLKLSDPGAMAAVRATPEQVEPHLGAWGACVVIANRNHRQQTVISGETAAVEAALAALKAAGFTSRKLRVSHAFHSPLMAGLARELAPAVNGLELQPPRIPVISAITGQAYPASPNEIRATFLRHATAQVDFRTALERCVQLGADFFLEVGAGTTLTGFASLGLADLARQEGGDRLRIRGTTSLAAAEDDQGRELYRTLGLLTVLGQPLRLELLYPRGAEYRPVSLPAAPLTEEHYWAIRAGNGTPPTVAEAVLAELPQTGAGPTLHDPTSSSQEPHVAEDLVKLFREQTAILAQQSAIIARQMELLGQGGSVADVARLSERGPELPGLAPSSPRAEVVAQPPSPPPVAPRSEEVTGFEVTGYMPRPGGSAVPETVLDIVARVSAFPRHALKPSQSLVTDLGLDSLMLVECAAALATAFPGLGQLPPTLLNPTTTIAELIAYIERTVGVAPAAEEDRAITTDARPGAPTPLQVELREEPEALAQPGLQELRLQLRPVQAGSSPGKDVVRRYRPQLQAAPPSTFLGEPFPADSWTLVTSDGSELAQAVLEQLAARGRRLVVVELGGPLRFTSATPTQLQGSCPRTPAEIDLLFEQLARHKIRPLAVLHLGDLETRLPLADVLTGTRPETWPDPLPLVQRLAANLHEQQRGRPQGFAVVTTQGGGFNLERPGATLWQSALVGFTKSLAREWDAVVKAIDVDPAGSLVEIAHQIVGELESADRTVEVGFGRRLRQVVGLVPSPFGGGSLPLDERSVVLVTGGARGLGFQVALELATHTRCGLLLLGSRPAADFPELEEQLAQLRATGARAEYVAWNLREAVPPPALAQARTRLGPLTGLIHCAGVLRDRLVGKKTGEEIQEVLEVKVAGLLHALRATTADPLRFVLAFSSWAGRFGNAGQTDYAAANELVDRIVAGLPELRPGLHAASLAWPPWADSAMARSIPGPVRSLLKQEGIPFLATAAGLQAVRDQLADGLSGTWVMGREQPAVPRLLRAVQPLSLESHPYLDSHRIKGTPILPLAAALDLLATLAREQQHLGGDAPLEVYDLQLHHGIEVNAPVRLIAEARGKLGQPAELELQGEDRVAYRARARAGQTEPTRLLLPAEPVLREAELPLSLELFYREVAFHGPHLQGIERIEQLGAHHLVGWVRTSHPAAWIAAPYRTEWAVDPLVIDSSFQLVLYWLWTQRRQAALPVGFSRFIQYAPFRTGPVKCTLVLGELTGQTLTGSLWYEDSAGNLLATLTDARAAIVELPPRATQPSPAVSVAAAPSPRPTTAGGAGAERPAGAASSPAPSSQPALPTPIDERHWRIDQFPAVRELYGKLQAAASLGLRNPYFQVNDGVARNTSVVDGRELINFSSYNYLGLSGDPAVSSGAKAAVDRYGTSVSASRVASGEKPIHRQLEQALARFLGCEASVVFSAGHATNESVIGFLFGEGDLILHDALAHNSIQQGAILSGARRRPFPHNDWQALDQLLTQLRPHYQKVLVAIEGVYSMDGDLPDLPRFIELRDRHRFLLFVDEAHSVGVLGRTGRGLGEHWLVQREDVDIWMGTLSKALASCGGYLAGSQALVDLIKYQAPGFVFSAGISPANAGAALAAVEQIQARPELVRQLHDRSRLFLELARAQGINTGMAEGSAVIPCIVGHSLKCLQLSQRLADRGINVQPIVYPAVDEQSARLRFFLSNTHTEEQIRFTVQTLAEELAALKE